MEVVSQNGSNFIENNYILYSKKQLDIIQILSYNELVYDSILINIKKLLYYYQAQYDK